MLLAEVCEEIPLEVETVSAVFGALRSLGQRERWVVEFGVVVTSIAKQLWCVRHGDVTLKERLALGRVLTGGRQRTGGAGLGGGGGRRGRRWRERRRGGRGGYLLGRAREAADPALLVMHGVRVDRELPRPSKR